MVNYEGDTYEFLVLTEFTRTWCAGLVENIEGKVLDIGLNFCNDTLHEVEILGNKVFTIVHDEKTADVKFDVVALFLGLEEVEGSAFGNVDNGFKFELTLDRDVLDCKVVLHHS